MIYTYVILSRHFSVNLWSPSIGMENSYMTLQRDNISVYGMRLTLRIVTSGFLIDTEVVQKEMKDTCYLYLYDTQQASKWGAVCCDMCMIYKL